MDSLERYREIVPNFEGFRAIQNLPLLHSARVNTLKVDRSHLLAHLNEEGIGYRIFEWYPLGLALDVESPGKLLANLQGYMHIQEEVSMVPP
ncbi:MAG: RsmB/NOP family class I SAM-dependent RNA methyltransferase, partial [Methanothrix sp.]|nr:RsmB/NOP family class I SAM-dependent RNA methyltransferase [Methanothrix sp.]